jgi:hypothetical protein
LHTPGSAREQGPPQRRPRPALPAAALPQGRDANRKLQRAIRAAKQRDRMPALLEAVVDVSHEWSVTEGEPFMYDGCDYAGEVLQQVRAARSAARRGTRKGRLSRSASVVP